jgi:O-antigen ligase
MCEKLWTLPILADWVLEHTLQPKAVVSGFFRISENVFLLNDPDRGFGTGFVGRDERWAFAWEIFKRYPLFGVGYDYYRNEGAELSPHNLWL